MGGQHCAGQLQQETGKLESQLSTGAEQPREVQSAPLKSFKPSALVWTLVFAMF